MPPTAVPGMSAAKQKLVRYGNCTAIVIPRALLHYLGWIPGYYMAIELLEDNTLRVRPIEERDWKPPAIPRLITGNETAVKR